MSKAVQNSTKKPSLDALRRAVASSTAVETGQSVRKLEEQIKQPTKNRFGHIKLAD